MGTAYQPSAPYNCEHEANIVCEAIGSHAVTTVLCALTEAYQAGSAECASLREENATLRRVLVLTREYDFHRCNCGTADCRVCHDVGGAVVKARYEAIGCEE